MIPGSISKVSEGIVASASTITVMNDLVRVTGSTQINKINPGLGTAQGQFLMLIPVDSNIVLGSTGNILGGGTIVKNKINTLVYSKPLQKWVFSVGLDGTSRVGTFISSSDFSCYPSGTFTVDFISSRFYYYIIGKQLTMVFNFSGNITPAGVTTRILVVTPPELIALVGSIGNNTTGNGTFTNAVMGTAMTIGFAGFLPNDSSHIAFVAPAGTFWGSVDLYASCTYLLG